ncbi:MAG: 4Fe-4S dicluster domain-containing protein [Prevotellaceae bacterium]|nr:4Fe-4S dicluster domain-containing protein [Prevotellaceae bacterium]
MTTVYISTGIAVLLWISFNLHRRRKNRHKTISIIESHCTGCRRCIKRCSRKVLEIVADESGQHAAVKYPENCTACGDCMSKCKFNALQLIERKHLFYKQ